MTQQSDQDSKKAGSVRAEVRKKYISQLCELHIIFQLPQPGQDNTQIEQMPFGRAQQVKLDKNTSLLFQECPVQLLSEEMQILYARQQLYPMETGYLYLGMLQDFVARLNGVALENRCLIAGIHSTFASSRLVGQAQDSQTIGVPIVLRSQECSRDGDRIRPQYMDGV